MNGTEFGRRNLDKTQVQLSEETRIAAWFISLIERGLATPTPDQAERLSKATGVPVADLLKPVEIVTSESRRD
jgi:transcriptional regulator with XRE-family HTH domain